VGRDKGEIKELTEQKTRGDRRKLNLISIIVAFRPSLVSPEYPQLGRRTTEVSDGAACWFEDSYPSGQNPPDGHPTDRTILLFNVCMFSS